MVPLRLGDRLEQLGRGGLGRVSGRQPGQRHLQRKTGREQLIEGDAVGLEHGRDRLAQVSAHAFVLRALDEDAAAGPARGPNQVRAGEQAQTLAQCRPADAELRRKLLLGPEPLARPETARREIPADLERDLLARISTRQPEPCAGRERHGEKLSSGATLTSRRSGSFRSPRPGSTSSSAWFNSSYPSMVRAGQPNARERPATSTSTFGQGPEPPCCSTSRSITA